MSDNFLNVQPSPLALVQSLRDIGYSMESAVADVIDNSITAKQYERISIFVPPTSSG